MDELTSFIVMLLLQGLAGIVFLLLVKHLRFPARMRATGDEPISMRRTGLLLSYLVSICILTILSIIIGMDSISGPFYGPPILLAIGVIIIMLLNGKAYLRPSEDSSIT